MPSRRHPAVTPMAQETERNKTAPRPSLGFVYGEAGRRFMLRPEATALAAVVVLFVVFTILSPQLFPTKLTYISVMSVAAELGIVSIGVTLLMIGGHFDLSVGAVRSTAVPLGVRFLVPRPRIALLQPGHNTERMY